MNTWLMNNARKLEKPRQLLPSCIQTRGGIWADIGCGEGIFTLVLFELLGSSCGIHAVDKNPRSLQKLLETFSELHPGADLHIHREDFNRPFGLPPLDGLLIANALHFVKDNDKRKVLTQLTTHLKPGGRAVIVEYNARHGNLAVPHPLDEIGFFKLAEEIGLREAFIAANAPSSFMGEMYAGVGIAPSG